MAQLGGIGVIHKNLSIKEQAEEVSRVKRYEAGMVVDPVTIGPDQPLADALALIDPTQDFRHSGSRTIEWSPGRHSDQPRCPFRHGHPAEGQRIDDQGRPGHRA